MEPANSAIPQNRGGIPGRRGKARLAEIIGKFPVDLSASHTDPHCSPLAAKPAANRLLANHTYTGTPAAITRMPEAELRMFSVKL